MWREGLLSMNCLSWFSFIQLMRTAIKKKKKIKSPNLMLMYWYRLVPSLSFWNRVGWQLNLLNVSKGIFISPVTTQGIKKPCEEGRLHQAHQIEVPAKLGRIDPTVNIQNGEMLGISWGAKPLPDDTPELRDWSHLKAGGFITTTFITWIYAWREDGCLSEWEHRCRWTLPFILWDGGFAHAGYCGQGKN